ncbi:MAG: LysR family transcriptional regulator [Pseudomonadota bacterium]
MDWSDLPYFLSVARSGQLARAAAAMGTDPTTVGRRIRRLEAALGERLFEQGPTGQTLTPAGAALFDRVEAMARIAGEIGHDGDDLRSLQGSVRVSVAEGFGTWFVAAHLGRFADAHPRLEIDLVANSGFLNPTRRETDLAVLLARPRRGPLITRKLTDYRLQLYAARGYLDAAKPIASLDALGRHRLIGYIPDVIYAPELRYLEELPIPASPQLRSSSINAQAAMIASGAGIGVLPSFIGDADPTLAVVLPEVRITRSFWLTTHRETHRFAPVRAFSDWLVALAAEQRGALLGVD